MGRVVKGVNDLYSWCMQNGEAGERILYEFGDGNNSQKFISELGIEWTPHDISKGSHDKIKWTCKECNESWIVSVSHRTYCLSACPSCGRKKLATPKEGVNDLYTWCMQNSKDGERILFEFGEGNNRQVFTNESGITVTPHDFSKSSHTKIKWTCKECNESWIASVHHRTCSLSGCPSCGKKRTKDGINDLYTWCMQNGEAGERILYEFGEGNNTQKFINEQGIEVTPHDVSRGTANKIKWTCKECNESWTVGVVQRTYSLSGCPSCGKKRTKDGINDLYTWCMQNGETGERILYEFGDGNNTQKFINEQGVEVTPHNISRGSGAKIKWTCKECNRNWNASIVDRALKSTGCPLCSKKRLNKVRTTPKDGVNDLYTWCMQNGEAGERILYEFGDGNNSQKFINEYGVKVTPHDFVRGSTKKIKWTCKQCNNSWTASIHSRRYTLCGCPLCGQKRSAEASAKRKSTPKDGINDLYTWCQFNGGFGKKLIQEWTGLCDNGKYYKMNEIARGSNRRFLWECSKHHKWYTDINHRTAQITNCPYCAISQTSYPEQFLYRALKQIYSQTISREKFNNIEYDIAIPEEKTCIEYSGLSWHLDKIERDNMKADVCKQHNVRFIQIYAHNGEYEGQDIFEENFIIYRIIIDLNRHNKQLVEILSHILKTFGHNISEIDIEKAQREAFNFMHNIEDSLNEGQQSVPMIPKSSTKSSTKSSKKSSAISEYEKYRL